MAFPISLTEARDNETDIMAAHINNLEKKVGVNGSADETSLDYKVSQIDSKDAAVLQDAEDYADAAVSTKQDSLGFTAEDVANKENTALDTSASKYPTNRLAKEYIDGQISGITPIAGSVVQIVDAVSSAADSTAVAIPYDDTIPQITEGKELFALSITPKYATSKIIVEAHVHCSITPAGEPIIALFQDSGVNALAASSSFCDTATGRINLYIYHSLTAGTTSAITFRLRFGPNTGTMSINGSSGTRILGATSKSHIKIIEVKA